MARAVLTLRSAICHWLSAICQPPSSQAALAAADEVDDLHRVPVVDRRGLVAGPLDDVEIVLHGHAPRLDLELGEQGGNGQRAGELERIAVQPDFQGLPPS